MVSTFGGLVGLIGIEHGLGEALQGNVAPSGLMILSWPDSPFFKVLGGEPAMTIVPNLLVTGLLAILVSLVYLLWAVLFVQRKYAGLVLMLLSIPMFLLGGGIFPPVLGILIGAAATLVHTPARIHGAFLSLGLRSYLARLWPWSFGAGVLSWLAMLPGIPLLDYFFGVSDENLIFTIIACMFGFVFLAAFAGFARDLAGSVAEKKVG